MISQGSNLNTKKDLHSSINSEKFLLSVDRISIVDVHRDKNNRRETLGGNSSRWRNEQCRRRPVECCSCCSDTDRWFLLDSIVERRRESSERSNEERIQSSVGRSKYCSLNRMFSTPGSTWDLWSSRSDWIDKQWNRRVENLLRTFPNEWNKWAEHSNGSDWRNAGQKNSFSSFKLEVTFCSISGGSSKVGSRRMKNSPQSFLWISFRSSSRRTNDIERERFVNEKRSSKLAKGSVRFFKRERRERSVNGRRSADVTRSKTIDWLSEEKTFFKENRRKSPENSTLWLTLR